VILEPVSVSPEGKEHPKQLCVHLPESTSELARTVDVVHRENRLAYLHVSHAVQCPVPRQWDCWLTRNC
jgi:2,4-dienoyl-CoA reductase-like NADH-dependent reductase (Old Yellow Enzyme family)